MFGKKKRAAKKADKGAKKTEATPVELAAAAAIPSSPAGKLGAVLATLSNPKTAKKFIAVGKVAAPVVAPLAYKAAAGTREYLDNKRAQRLGVTANEVAAYRGVTGPVEARLDGLARAIADLNSRRGSELEVVRFVDVTRTRLKDLTAATQAAATMPPSRRRATLKAISRELNQVDADLMTYLVGTYV